MRGVQFIVDEQGNKTAVVIDLKKDAELWLKLAKISGTDEYMRMIMDSLFLPIEDRTGEGPMMRQMAFLPLAEEAERSPFNRIERRQRSVGIVTSGIVYHYGRWTKVEDEGWCWIPDYEWGPAWVSWRESDDYVGWAPLPPESR